MPITATAVRTSFLPFGCNHAAVRKAMSAGIPLFQAFSPISVQGSTYCDCIKDGRKIDPCCGSGWMFVQSEEFVKEHQGKIDDLAVYGEESNPTTWKLAKMNLAIRGIDNDLGPHQGDTFANDMHKVTDRLVKEYDVIVIEDLKVKNMTKNHHLSRSILRQSWSRFREMLEYKCKKYGKTLVVVNPAYTSRICSICGQDTDKKPLSVREWDCPFCKAHHDRDVNAAVNILNKGLSQLVEATG